MSGMYVPPNSNSNHNGSDTSSGGSASSQPIIVYHENGFEWIINSSFSYLLPTIYVTQIGKKVLPEPLKVDASWGYLESGKTIRITFDRVACTGFVILHQN